MASDYRGVVAARLPIRFPPCVRLGLLQTYSTATSRLDPGLFFASLADALLQEATKLGI